MPPKRLAGTSMAARATGVFGRRALCGAVAVGAAATGLGRAESAMAATTKSQSRSLKLGLASYSLRKLSVDEVVAFCHTANLHHLTLKDMHLPRDEDGLNAARNKYLDGGISIMGVGVIYMKNDPEKVRQDFRYAKAAGAPLLVAAPDIDALDLVEGLVKEFNLPVAIHNHGPEDKLYPGPSDVMKHIERRDKRMGVCMDVGHTVRAGEDPVALVRKLGARLLDLHVKDLKDKTNKDSQTESGKGVIDLVGLMAALMRARFSGQVGLEYEINADDPLPGIRESLGYLRGVLAGLGGRAL